MNSRTLCALLSLSAAIASAQPVNDTCANAIPIEPPTGYLSSRSVISPLFGAATASETPFSCLAASNSSVWYSFTPAVSARYEFQTCADNAPGTTTANTVMAIYDGVCGGALTELTQGCNDNFCASMSRTVVTMNAGTTYLVQIAKGTATVPTATDAVQLTVNMPSGADSCVGPVPVLPMYTSVPVALALNSVDDSRVGALAC